MKTEAVAERSRTMFFHVGGVVDGGATIAGVIGMEFCELAKATIALSISCQFRQST